MKKKESKTVLIIKHKPTGKEYRVKSCDLSDREYDPNKEPSKKGESK